MSIAVVQNSVDGEPDDDINQPCVLTFNDVFDYVDDEEQAEERPDSGGVMRLSEASYYPFWTYYNRFIRYFPTTPFNVKYAYHKGFIEKKRRNKPTQSLSLFDALAIEMTERHLDAGNWAAWKGGDYRDDPMWLGLHTPKSTTVDLIDVDAKQYRIGYYRELGTDKCRLMPVIHLPLDHFKMLKRIYDAFPGRIWAISSETLGIHAWEKHVHPRPSWFIHQINKKRLAQIGLPAIEAHPMPGRCLRRPFGADYRTITPDGVLKDWIEQVRYFEDHGKTPSFDRICREMLKAMVRQWKAWERYGDDNRKVDVRSLLEKFLPEIKEVNDWLKAGCPLEQTPVIPAEEFIDPTLALCREILADTLGDTPAEEPSPILRICQAILLVTFGEKTNADIKPILMEAVAELNGTVQDNSPPNSPRSTRGSKREDLASLRGGNWAKELLRLARGGLDQEDSVATVVHEMAKWLWWVELYSLQEGKRREEITRLLTAFVAKKHNGCVSRLINGQGNDVVAQIRRCVELAATISVPTSLECFERIRGKWLNGGYKHPIRIVPALAGQKDISSLSPCQLTVMCIKFDDQLPEDVKARIKAVAGRNKVMDFATQLLNRLYIKGGKAFLGRKALIDILGYGNANQIAKYVGILEKAGVITKGSSYSVGRNGKGYYLTESAMNEMRAARTQ